jgi:CheY-like chemotaxis protein
MKLSELRNTPHLSSYQDRKNKEEGMLGTETVVEKGPHRIPGLASKRQVLVINDNKTVREALSRMIVSLDYNVTLAGNGFQGGILFLTRSYDLAIIDLDVPQMNVWELARIFKEHSPNIPVIVASGLAEDMHWEKAGMSCVDAIIPKPFMLKEIEGTVRRLLNNGV